MPLPTFGRSLRGLIAAARGSKPQAAPAKPEGRADHVVHGLVMSLDRSEHIQRAMADEAYEVEQAGWVRDCLKPGDRFVDVGANFGFFATLASTCVGASGSVFAFEPSPLASRTVRATVSRNALTNLTLIEAAVGSSSGSIVLHMPVGGEVHSPSVFASDPNFTPLDVEMVALDDYQPLWDGPPVAMMKVDVEGSEPDVIAGAARLLRAGRIRNILCELNSGWLDARQDGASMNDLAQQVESYGFRRKRWTERTSHAAFGGGTFSLQDIWFTLD